MPLILYSRAAQLKIWIGPKSIFVGAARATTSDQHHTLSIWTVCLYLVSLYKLPSSARVMLVVLLRVIKEVYSQKYVLQKEKRKFCCVPVPAPALVKILVNL